MLLAKNYCFRGDLIYPQKNQSRISGSLLVLRRPGDVLHRDTYAAFLVPEGTVYRDLRTNLSAFLVNPGTLSACTGVVTAKKTDLYENDVVRFGSQFTPYLVVYDRGHLSFALQSARQTMPLLACMGSELTVLGDLFRDGDYLYESPLMDPWLYLKDAEQDRLEMSMFGNRADTDRQALREGDASLAALAKTAGEGRRGWLSGSLITLQGKTSSGKITKRCFLVPEDATEEDFVSGRVLPEEVYPDSLSKATGLWDAAGEEIFEGDSLVHAAGNIPFTLEYGKDQAGLVLSGPEGDIPATPALLRQMVIANDALEEQEENRKQEPQKIPTGPAPKKVAAKAQAPAAPKANSGAPVQCQACGKITKYGYGKCPACRAPLDPKAMSLRDPVEWTTAYKKAIKRAKKNIEEVFHQRYPDGKPEEHLRQYNRIKQQELLKLGFSWKTPEEVQRENG